MTGNEFRELTHGDKIKGPDGTIYIVHNNHRSGEGMIVATRSMVIPYKDSVVWKRVSGIGITIAPGVYEVTINKKIN